MPVDKIKAFLEEHGVDYEIAEHPEAFTAQEVAAEAHVPGRHFAKVVTVKVDDRMALAVVPATERVNLERLGQSLGAESVSLATEAEFADRFPDCEPGAMPPFGNLFGMETFLSPRLTAAEEIVFNAGTHTEVMRLSFHDFERLVEPIEVEL